MKTIPVVFLTSHAEREMVEKVRGITRYGYVIKNSGNYVLRSSIEMAFDLFEAHGRTEKSNTRNLALLNALPDAMFLFSREGLILDCHHPVAFPLLAESQSFLG